MGSELYKSEYFDSGDLSGGFFKFFKNIQDFLNNNEVETIITIIAIIFIVISLYSLVRIFETELKEKHIAKKVIVPEPILRPKNEKWELVLKHIASGNPSDWRLAIIEADTILDELTQTMGYSGGSLGERLKNAEEVGNFRTLNGAWEAHKIRNQIAHTGSDFDFNKHKAEETIRLFEEVFEEFDYI